MPHVIEQAGQDHRTLEHFALVDEVRESMRVLFLLELVTRMRTLFVEQLGNAVLQRLQQVRLD